jgi:RimJ/RimL family protein N-acetyltransferase
MIHGAKTRLRAVELTDAVKYHEWVNDEQSNQTRGLYHPTSLQEAQSWIEARCSTNFDTLSLAIETIEGVHIGFIGFRAICPRSRRAEVTLHIGDKREWRKGYGRDALSTLCLYGFESMNLHRIWLECDAAYEKIIAAYESVGFRREGRLRDSYFRHGGYRDTLIMGLLESEWRQGRQ